MAPNSLKRKLFLFEMGDIVLDVLLMAIAVIGLQYFVVSAFVVSGASMEITLHDQEIVLVNRLGHGKYILRNEGQLQRGDVVVFRPPIPTDQYYIKRIIGVPGDTVRFDQNRVLVNDVQVSEPYANCNRNESLATFANSNPSPCTYDVVNGKTFLVPAGRYFVMGDNRMRSDDSRTCFKSANTSECPVTDPTHFVPFDNIVGKAWFVLWPWNAASSSKHTGNFFQKLWPLDNIRSIDRHDPLRSS